MRVFNPSFLRMRPLGAALVFAALLATSLTACGQPPHVGGVYTAKVQGLYYTEKGNANHPYGVVKILKQDGNDTYLKLYSNRYTERPKTETQDNLTIFEMKGIEEHPVEFTERLQFGPGGIILCSPCTTYLNTAVFLRDVPVTEDERNDIAELEEQKADAERWNKAIHYEPKQGDGPAPESSDAAPAEHLRPNPWGAPEKAASDKKP